MKNIARIDNLYESALPPVEAPEARWRRALVDPRAEVSVHPRYAGTALRRDGWGCTNRRLACHWLLLVLDGEVRLTVSDRRRRIGGGSLVWVPPGARHDMQWSTPLRMSELYLGVGQGGKMLRPSGRVRIYDEAAEIRAHFDAIADEMESPSAWTADLIRGRLLAAFAELQRGTAPDSPTPRGGLNAGQRSRVLRLTRQRIVEGLSPRDLAEAVELSGPYFSRLFVRSFGVSPRVWLSRRRIEAGQRMLEETDRSVAEVAAQLGYTGPAQFSRQFSQVTGLSPRLYRSSSR
ncbi:MAG: AraC family transcriptional regulator [Planctomycetota bacterium]